MNVQDQEKIIEIISKVLNGSASEEEQAFLSEWVNKSELNNTYFQQLRRIWAESGKTVDFSKVSANNALKKVNQKSNKTKITLWQQWRKIAAIIIFPLLLVNINYFIKQETKYANNFVETMSPKGTRSTIELPDGSKVWLNSGAKLRYPNQFKGKIRVVYLIGEAYFEVRSDMKNPFIVDAGGLKVKATGTRFNVHNKNNNQIEVTLAEGSVTISNQDKKLTTLEPNQRLIFNIASQQYITSNDDAIKYISWKDGKLMFRNDPLVAVAERLSYIYSVDIEMSDEALKSFRYRATFENESIDEILKLIERTSPITVVEQKRVQNQNGEYAKRRFMVVPKGEIQTNK